MFFCNIWPKQTFLPLFLGSLIEPIGLGLLTVALKKGSVGFIQGMLAVSGVGTGLRLMPGTLHAVGVRPKRIAQSLSIMSFAIPFGGTLGLAIMGSVFNNKLAIGLAYQGRSNNATSSLDYINGFKSRGTSFRKREGKKCSCLGVLCNFSIHIAWWSLGFWAWECTHNKFKANRRSWKSWEERSSGGRGCKKQERDY